VPRGTPLFESLVVVENYPLDAALAARAGRLGIGDVRAFEQTHYPLTLTVVPGDDLLLRVGYDPRRFDDAAIDRLLGHFATLLERLATGFDRRLEDLSMLTADEEQQLLRRWSESSAGRPDGDDATATPGEIEIEVERLSDAELDSLLSTLLLEPEGDRS
jgi:non-ribosomal peptide synthetase component F